MRPAAEYPEIDGKGGGLPLHLPAGLPAFEHETSFLLLAPPEIAPLILLQSAHTPGLCFLTIPVGRIMPEYEPAVSAEDASIAQYPSGAIPNDAVLLAILTVSNQNITANLSAPLLINPVERLGVQTVRSDKRYSARHPVSVPGSEVSACS